MATRVAARPSSPIIIRFRVPLIGTSVIATATWIRPRRKILVNGIVGRPFILDATRRRGDEAMAFASWRHSFFTSPNSNVELKTCLGVTIVPHGNSTGTDLLTLRLQSNCNAPRLIKTAAARRILGRWCALPRAGALRHVRLNLSQWIAADRSQVISSL